MVKKTQPQQQEILDECKPQSFIDEEAEVKVSKNTASPTFMLRTMQHGLYRKAGRNI